MRSLGWCLAFFFSAALQARLITVGPQGEFALPSEAARVVKPGDVVEIDAGGDYRGDVAVWRVDGIILRGVNGRPELHAAGRAAQGKGIWVIRGEGVVVEDIAFIGARVRDKNGAGIRFERGALTVRRCLFRDNENGILTASKEGMRLRVEDSEFLDNGHGDGFSHQIYAGRIDRLEVIGSRFLRARIGHHIKSRARANFIAYNRIEDGPDGRSSYAIDLANGGEAWLVGNLIQQGPKAENVTLIAFGMEGMKTPGTLFLVHNTLVNNHLRGLFVRLAPDAVAWIGNNIFAGTGRIVRGEAVRRVNLKPSLSPRFRDAARGDYRPRADALVVDAARPWPDSVGPLHLCCEPPPPGEVGARRRRIHGRPDLGAWEAAR